MPKHLTQKQKEAVESTAATTMVIAGPGTGKTHILASRIQYLVEKQKIEPSAILSLTFTNSGAHAMRQRVIEFLDTRGYDVEIETFHSFASHLIDNHPEVFGYKHDLKALTNIDRAKIIRSIIDEMFRDGSLKELTTYSDTFFYFHDIAGSIKKLKGEGINKEEYAKMIKGWEKSFNEIPDGEKISTRGARVGKLKIKYEEEQRKINKNKELILIYEKYEEALLEQSRYDYEDMILRAAEGLNKSKALLWELQKTYKAILVDEYQDTNNAQNKLLFLLINKKKPNVFIVGDDDQAIYRFQGATIENFIEFIDTFPRTKIVALEDNFRSPQFILDAAMSLANKNQSRITKKLGLPEKILRSHAQHKDNKEFSIYEFSNDLEEHAYIVGKVKELNKAGVPWEEIAILTRNNGEQKETAEILRQNKIPYTISADQNALTEPRTSSLFSLVQACLNPRNDEALMSFLRHPATDIKIEDVYKILAGRKRDESLYDAFFNSLKVKENLYDYESAQKTFNTLNELSQNQEVMSGAHWLQSIIEKTGFMNWIIQQEDAPFIIANIRALTDEAKRVQEGNEYIRMQDIMEHFQSYRDLKMPLKPRLAQYLFENALRIMTAHQAKGQEFQYVFIIHAVEEGWSKGKRPNKLPLPSDVPARTEDAEDARRLFYVALTRAKKGLVITYSKVYTNGLSGNEDRARETIPSIFITELSNYITPTPKKIDATNLMKETITPKTYVSDVQKEVVREIVSSERFGLNATSYNNFIECPNIFLYENVLRVPKIKNFALTYGEVIHLALQKYFEADADRRNLDYLLQTVQIYLDQRSTLTGAENREVFTRAEKSLKNYMRATLSKEPEPISIEKSFTGDKSIYDGVKLSGKIDKISPLLDSNKEVKVVDYKTNQKAKSANAILGKTQDKNAQKYLWQLMFYKLLLEIDTEIDYKPTVFALDFVDVAREVQIELDEKEYGAFKDKIKNVWDSIQTLAFLESSDKFPHCGECVYCALAV